MSQVDAREHEAQMSARKQTELEASVDQKRKLEAGERRQKAALPRRHSAI